MARVTVEDCIDKVESPYELVLVAKERATQLNSGLEPTLAELIPLNLPNLTFVTISSASLPVLCTISIYGEYSQPIEEQLGAAFI